MAVTTSIGPTSEGVDGASSVADLETMLALTNLRLTRPRIDDGPVATVRGESRLIADDPGRRADTATTRAFDELYWRDDPRLRHLTTRQDLDQLDPDRALAVHQQRFGDVSDFVFVLVGDFDPAQAVDLANRYLGTLPGSGRADDASIALPEPVDEPVRRTVEAGTGDQARVQVGFDVATDIDPTLRDRAVVLQALVRAQMLTRIREQLGASYSPVVSIGVDEDTRRVRSFITIESDPERVQEIAAEAQRVLAELRDDGPTAAQLSQAIEPIRRDLGFVDHPRIIRSWMYLLEHPDAPVQDVPAAAEVRLAGLGPTDMQQLARRLFPADAFVEVVQIPAR